MRIKKYVSRSMREALLQIKDELGEEAIILKTRKIPKKVFGIAGQDEIEVTAAVDDEAAARKVSFAPLKMNERTTYNRPRSSGPGSDKRAIPPPEIPEVRTWNPRGPQGATERNTASSFASGNCRSRTLPGDQEDKDEILELKENIRELKDLVRSMMPVSGSGAGNGSPPVQNNWDNVAKALIDSEVKGELAVQLIDSLKRANILSDGDIEQKLASALSNSFPVSGPLKLRKESPVIVLFVGPTGSGKTTTLAKLAAHCKINKGKRVSIITADTYRIAAIEQIRMFADIVKVGLQVVFSPEEVPAAIASCEGDEVIFVDTAGRSQRNSQHMEDLKQFVSALRPDETHLVLSATTKDSDLLENINLYRPLGVNRLLFTKLDETMRPGNIFNVVSESAVPVSYFTFGQSVPDDIELAQPGKFVKRLMEGRL